MLFYVVSDVWMGRATVIADTRAAAEAHQYRETLTAHGYDEDRDQDEVRPGQFRAWPVDTWPHELEFEQAFHWIGRRVREKRERKSN